MAQPMGLAMVVLWGAGGRPKAIGMGPCALWGPCKANFAGCCTKWCVLGMGFGPFGLTWPWRAYPITKTQGLGLGVGVSL